MKERSFVKNASILAFSTIIAKLIGAGFRIPLTNILGAEGMGVYQLVFPVFALLLTISSGAVPTAIAILVSQKRARNEETGTLFFSCLVALSALGLIMSFLLIVLSKPISMLQSNPLTQAGYFVIAPAIMFVSIISVFRGYFMGNKNMIPPAISQITEGAIKLVLGLFLAKLLLYRGIEFAVMGALLGVTISEFFTLIVLILFYKGKESFKVKISFAEFRSNIKSVWSFALPLTMGGIIIPLSLFFDSLMIVNLLNIKEGISSATMNYGLLSGTVAPLINMPIMLSLSLGVAVVPMITEEKVFRDLKSIKQKSEMCIKLALIIGVPFLLFFLFLAEDILRLLYPVLSPLQLATATTLMRIESINIIGLSIGQISASMLQSLGNMKQPVKVLLGCVVLKTLLNLILLPLLGITGGAIASATSFSINCIINTAMLQNLIGKSKSMAKNTSLIALCGVIMSLSVFGLVLIIRNSWAIWAILPLSGLVYVMSLLALGVFSKTELKSLPLSSVWLRINKIIRRKDNAIV